MPVPAEVSRHYSHGRLTEAIRDGLAALGKTPDNVTTADLAPVDEFHIGGRQATEWFLDQLGLNAESRVLDVGCGLGGPARFAATRYGCGVTGIDLTSEFIETGNTLCGWLGLNRQVELVQGSALQLPFADASFDAAYMIHVGMNIADKDALMREVARVLRSGALFGIYDVMQIASGELAYPLPWASGPELSALANPDRYRAALQSAGFAVVAECMRVDFALAYFADQKARVQAVGGPPPLGLHVLLGPSRAQKVDNMAQNIAAGLIAPVELIARKR
jgi:SAM-dependent methyltransferase